MPATQSRMTEWAPDLGSFRDRSNRVYHLDGKVLRGVDQQSLANWRALRTEGFFVDLLSEGKVIGTEEFDGASLEGLPSAWPGYLAHDRVPVITYPYEWSFGMLKDAALLHLDILLRAIPEGWTLKDATAYNVQWQGPHPVFIDIPSFEPYVEGDPWVGYRQFCMMFLYPLMFKAYRDIDYIPFLRGSLEGIDPHVANQVLTGFTRFRKGVLGHVYLHSRFQGRFSGKDLDEARELTETANAGGPAERKRIRHSPAMVLGTIDGLRRVVERLRVPERRTTWGNYDSEHSYASDSAAVKAAFVEKHVLAKKRRVAWDLGCNTGTFSKICAKNTDIVLSVDGDDKAIERLYQDQKVQDASKILPLVMNLANVSPNHGWRGRERAAFDQRGKPELVLCLALIHHIVISANIPLEEFLGWLRDLGADVVIELVSLEDDMTKMLLRNRVNQYQELEEANFERVVSELFEIKEAKELKGGHRKLYYLEPK